jgi:hypothetical protein
MGLNFSHKNQTKTMLGVEFLSLLRCLMKFEA